MDPNMDEQSKRMLGKRALVTGAGTGIGRAVGLELAREGAAVVFHYAYKWENAISAAEEVIRAGGKAKALQADFIKLDSLRHLADEAVDFLGGVDILVNNAGISMNAPIEKVTPEEFDTLYNVNIRAMFFLTQAVVPHMLQHGKGTVVNLSSIHAFGGQNEHSVYAGTKGAIVAFTRQLAIELAPKGVRVNAIAPGAIEVENYYKAIPEFDPIAFGRFIPAGFLGQPRDIARVVVFLASEDSRYIVGQTLVVDGGTTAWFAFREDFRESDTAVWGKGYVPGR